MQGNTSSQTITAQDFLQLYDQHKTNRSGDPFIKVNIEKSKVVETDEFSVKYYNVYYKCGVNYRPLFVRFDRFTNFYGFRKTDKFKDACVTMSLRDSSKDKAENPIGLVFKILDREFTRLVKHYFHESKYLSFRQTIDKDGEPIDDPYIRVKARHAKDGKLMGTYVCAGFSDKPSIFTRDNIQKLIHPHSECKMIINFSYLVETDKGVSNSCCLKEMLYKNSKKKNEFLANDPDFDDIDDDDDEDSDREEGPL